MADTTAIAAPSDPPRRVWLPLLGAVLFAAAHTQAPDLYSNQNQYYLHGLAAGGYGDLRTDWLSTTADPTPVFSTVVATAYRYLGLWPLQVVYVAVLMGYFLCLTRIAGKLTFRPTTVAGQIALAAGLIVVHSAIVRVASVELVGKDYPWYFHAGIANQYVLGPVFQPSVVGVLLITALMAFADNWPRLAAVLVAVTCTFHSTYLLPGAMLIAGMMFALWRLARPGAALATGGLALLGVAAVLAYNLTHFAPTSAEQFADAQRIVAWGRIPHHTDPSVWLDWVAGLQIVWIIAGIAAYRRTGLFPVLVTATAISIALSLTQVVTGSAFLALVFPWRLSAVLVPLATLAAVTAGARGVERILPRVTLAVLAGVATAVAVIGSVLVIGRGYQDTPAEAGLLRYIDANHRPGELYLLPTKFPDPPQGRGTGSSTFMPNSAPPDRPTIFALQRFRLGTGAAAYIDYKSIPYKDSDVLEWHTRVANVERWYDIPDWDAAGVIDEITSPEVGATHVVVPAGTAVRSDRLVRVFQDSAYAVYRIEQGDGPGSEPGAR